MSISKCLICQKCRRPVRKYRNLFPADCIGCGTQHWQEEITRCENWQEICLTPSKVARQRSISPNSKSDIPITKEQTPSQYLQIGYRHSKQNWGSKAFHIFNNIIRRRNSAVQSISSNASREIIEPFNEAEPRADSSDVEWPTVTEAENQSKEEKEITGSFADEPCSDNNKQESKICIINEVNEDFVEPTESGVDVLTLMQLQLEDRQFEDRAVSVGLHTRPASDQTLFLKCCCSDADLTKPSMCGDRACISCSVHDHRLIARQVSMAAEAAANAAASVLAVPTVQSDHRSVQQTSQSSVTTIPGTADVHCVLHSVRSALEHRQRLFRTEPVLRTSVPCQTTTVESPEVATCTTPPDQDATTTKPILHTLGKMYQKHLFISALFHNMTATDVKKIDCKINDFRTKIEQLEDVCKQQKPSVVTAEMAVGDESVLTEKHKPVTVDAGVGEGEIREKKTTLDIAVGEEEVNTVDKETQDTEQIVKMIDSHTDPVVFDKAVGDKGVGEETVEKETQKLVDIIDEFTEPTYFGVETGTQAESDEGVGVTEVFEIGVQVKGDEKVGGAEDLKAVDSVVSEDPWRQLSQLSDLSSADLHSLNFCNPHQLEAFLQQLENSPKTEHSDSIPDIQHGSAADYLRQAAAASVSKVKSMSMQKYRLCKPLKVSDRTSIRRTTEGHQSPGRYRAIQNWQKNRSPPRLGIPSLAVQTHPTANPKRTIAASSRFAGGRSGMNNNTLRRGLGVPTNKYTPTKYVSTMSVNKPTPLKFVSTLRK